MNHETSGSSEGSKRLDYAKSTVYSLKNRWLYKVVGFTAVVTFSTLIPEDMYPAVYLRWILGSFLIFYLPGYCLTEMLFPSRERLDGVERLAISIGLSLTVVIFTGVILNFVWKISFTPVIVALSAVTTCLAVAAVTRRSNLPPMDGNR